MSMTFGIWANDQMGTVRTVRDEDQRLRRKDYIIRIKVYFDVC